MSASEFQKPSTPYGNMGLYLAGIVLAVGVWGRLEAWMAQIWKTHESYLFMAGGIAAAFLILLTMSHVWNKHCDRSYDRAITSPDATSVHLGTHEAGNDIYLKQKFRTMHTQVIGTTSAGKTESIILPWAIKDIENGLGFLMIDGKSDRSFLDKLYAYTVQAGREKDFRLFSFSEMNISTPFNPLAGGSVREIVERVFSSFTFENEYYRNVQYKVFTLLVSLLHKTKQSPNFLRIQQLLTQPELLRQLAHECGDLNLDAQVAALLKESPRDRSEKLSGLEACVSHFTSGEISGLFNSENGISFEEALQKNQICYFQLPSMYFPFLAEVTGKLVLQSFQNAVAKRQLGMESKAQFFSCYLDDFQDYIYPGFGALLNKARSANIGVVFSHQALGDLDKVSPAFRNIVLTNTNIKCVLRNNDPDTAEYFARSFGTETTEKLTERLKTHFFWASKTGESSLREVEQYKVHPNQIRGLGVGQGFVTIPHLKGVKTLKVHFQMRPDLSPVENLKPVTTKNEAFAWTPPTLSREKTKDHILPLGA